MLVLVSEEHGGDCAEAINIRDLSRAQLIHTHRLLRYAWESRRETIEAHTMVVQEFTYVGTIPASQ